MLNKTKNTQSSDKQNSNGLLFGKNNFVYMIVGLVLILLGFVLMSGGEMTDPNIWDTSVIYSHRRITVAPILVLIGLGLQVFAVFKKS